MMKKIVILILTLLLIFTMACSCSLLNFNRLPEVVVETGSGNVITKEFDISAVNTVEIESIGTLHLTQGDTPSLTIEAEDTYMDDFEVKVIGDRLEIKVENQWFNSWLPTEPIHYYLTLPTVEKITLAGAIRLEADTLDLSDLELICNGANNVELGTVTADDVTLEVAGAANMNIETLTASGLDVNIAGISSVNVEELQAETLDLHISGTGNMTVAGEVQTQTITIEGGGNYDAGNLKSAATTIDSAGAASATVWTTDTLELNCDGAAHVGYYGSPSIEQNNNGMAVINSLGEK